MFFKCMTIAALVMSSGWVLAAGDQQVGLKRPFRTGMFKLSPELDHQKPLAPADYAGWVEQGKVLFGSPNSKDIVALSLQNKTELWRKPLAGDLTAPAFPLADSIVLAQYDGTLSKLDTRDGHTIWQIKLPSFIPIRLTKDNDRIFAVTASQVLYAINIKDGKIEWLYDPELPSEIRIHNSTPPSLNVSQLFWGLSNGDIVAIDIETGKKSWRRNPKLGGGGRFHNYMGSMYVSNKRLVFCRYDGLIGAASLESGREGELVWEVEGNTGNCADSDYRGGRLYAVTTSGDALAIHVETGKNLWSGLKLGTGLSTVTAIEEYVIITGSDGQIYALNLDGTIVWYDSIEGRILTHPFFVDKKAYFATGLKNIYSYLI